MGDITKDKLLYIMRDHQSAIEASSSENRTRGQHYFNVMGLRNGIPDGDARLQMDEYLTKVASYRAGGDGGNCLKILKAYIGNVVKHPDDVKYRRINTENKAYRTKVKPFLGAKSLLLCVGFSPSEDGTALELNEDADMKVLAQAKEKVEAAYERYMK